MRVLLLALPGTDHTAIQSSLATALGASGVDLCHAVEAAVSWLANAPCDLVAVAGPTAAVCEGLERIRRVSGLPLLALLPDTLAPDAGAAWLAGADDVLTLAGFSSAALAAALEQVRNADRDVTRRMQKFWYAGAADPLRQQLLTRLGGRFQDVGLTGEGLSGLTTQDVEAHQSAALVVNALTAPEAMVLGVRRVKRLYPALAVTVLAGSRYHDAFHRAGADECVAAPGAPEPVLQAVGRAQGHCRTSLELEAVRARETRLRSLVEQLPEAVVLVSAEHSVLAVNVAGLRLIGAHDARQVLGAPLAPWLRTEAEDGLTALVDTVVGGASQDVVAVTAQLPRSRRMLVRAVPFQREPGGRPAALMVLRELATDQRPGPLDAEAAGPAEPPQRPWDDERAGLLEQVAALRAQLAAALTDASRVAILEEGLATALAREQALAPALGTLATLEAFGVEVERLPELLDAQGQLRALQQDVRVLERQLAEAATTADALVHARQQVCELEAQLAQLSAAAGSLQAQASRAASLEAQLVEAANQALALQNHARRAMELEGQLEELAGRNRALQAEHERLGRQEAADNVR